MIANPEKDRVITISGFWGCRQQAPERIEDEETTRGNVWAITVLSEYHGSRCRKIVTNEKRQVVLPAASHQKKGEPWRARTSDPLIKSAFTGTPVGYGSYDLFTLVSGCSASESICY